jgi:Winged helix DNA-binding domain
MRKNAAVGMSSRSSVIVLVPCDSAATNKEVELAISDRAIVRTWPLRGTLHFVAAADVHWLLELTAPRMVSTTGSRFERYGLDSAVLAGVRKVLVKALRDGQQLTRDEIYAVLQRAGISVEGQRGYHILWRMVRCERSWRWRFDSLNS